MWKAALHSPWTLALGLMAANVGTVALVVLLPLGESGKPPFVPEVRWRADGRMGREPLLERHMRTMIRSEIQQAVAVQEDETALVRLQQFYQRPSPGPPGIGGVSPLTTERVRPDLSPRPLLRPFGLHRPGPLGMALYLASLLTFFILSFIALYLFPRRLRIVQGSLEQGFRELLRVGAVGLLGYGLIFLLVTLLTLLVVGIPLAALLSLGLAPLTFFGLVAISLALGRWSEERIGAEERAPMRQLAVGLLLLFPLGILPLVSWPTIALLASLGFGAVLVTKFGSEEGWSLKALEEADRL